MKTYRVTLMFTDVDNNFWTKGKAEMGFDVNADDIETAQFLGERLLRILGADDFSVKLTG